jgi:hypothetical protein
VELWTKTWVGALTAGQDQFSFATVGGEARGLTARVLTTTVSMKGPVSLRLPTDCGAAKSQAMSQSELPYFASVKACRPEAESLLGESPNSDQKSQREYLPRRRDAKGEREINAENL